MLEKNEWTKATDINMDKFQKCFKKFLNNNL